MKFNIENFGDYFLDSILDDYYYLWEAYSDFERHYTDISEVDLKTAFLNFVLYLYELELISFYYVNIVNGVVEEKEIKIKITEDLLDKLLDWKNSDKYKIGVTTSKKAEDYLYLKYKLRNSSL